MQAHNRYGAVLREFPGLADMEVEQTMLFREDHDEVGVIVV